MRIEGKTYTGNLKIELHGTHGIKLTIERTSKEDVYIVIDERELKVAMEEITASTGFSQKEEKENE